MTSDFDDGDEICQLELTDLWADIVCGRDKQDVSAILVAPKGYGKSHTAMTLCHDTAHAIAKRKGGKWTDYFPYNEETKAIPNVACIVQEDIVKLMGMTSPFNVYLLDDVAVGMNARKFASDNNILINEIFQLMRIDQCVTITTTMDQSYVDKVPREIIGWFIEIVEPHHDEGYNVLKVFRNKKQFRSNKMHQVYINDKSGRYTRFVTEGPPAFLADAYDLLRSRKTAEHRKKRLDEYVSMVEGEVPMNSKEAKLQMKITTHGNNLSAWALDGVPINEMSRRSGLSTYDVNKILGNLGVSITPVARTQKVSA